MDYESEELKRHRATHKSRLKVVLNQLLQSFKISRSDSAKTIHKTMKIAHEYIEFLQHIDFRMYLKNLYPELIVSFGHIRGQIDLTGSVAQVENTIVIIREETLKINVKHLTLSQSNLVWNIVAKNRWNEYFARELVKENIKAKVCLGASHSVSILASSPNECERGFEIMFEVLKENIFPVSKDYSLQSLEFQSLISKLEQGSLIQIVPNIEENSIKIFGIEEDTSRASKEISDFLGKWRIISDKYKPQVSQSIWNFFAKRVDHTSFFQIEKDLEQFRVSIKITDDRDGFLLCGFTEGIEQCKQRLTKLIATIIEQQKNLVHAGLQKLFLDQAGKEQLIMIEREMGVDITIAHIGKQFSQRRPVPLPRKLSLPVKDCIYDVCNFTTNEGIKVSWKYGRIDNEMADVLVNSANSNLNNLTASGKALMIRGGPHYVEACKRHTDVQPGDIVVTKSGDLLSESVIHAVCYDACKFKEESPPYEFLRGMIRKILEKCQELDASSLAMPMIGAGQNGYSEEFVAQAIQSEVNDFSSKKGPGLTLKHIRVIVFPKALRRQSVPVPIRPRIVSSSSDPASSCPTEIAFGTVRIFLCRGNVTQYEADTMMNLLPKPVRASSNKTSRCVDAPNGSVRVQTATLGNIKYYLHCVPVSFDISGLERATKASLNAVKFLSQKSVIILPAGMTSFGVTPNDCADAILKASEMFSNSNYAMLIRVVVFDAHTTLIFKTAFEKRVEEQMTRFENSAVKPKHPKNERLNIGGKDEVTFRVVGFQHNVNLAFEKIEEHSNRNKERRSINDRESVDNLWRHQSEIKELLKSYEVVLTSTAEEVVIEGMKEQVLECMLVLRDCLNKYKEGEKEGKRLREISESVQWSYSDENGVVLLDEILNGMVESELREGNEIYTIPGTEYEVNLTDNVIVDRRTGHKTQLTRKNLQLDLPRFWETQTEEQNVHLVTLPSSSHEYQNVIDLLDSAKDVMIVQSITRIQNPRLYKLYLGKKESMGKEPNEKELFHGTKTENIQSINTNNFNRRFSGINGTRFGHGVYFARDALYSVRFSQEDSKEEKGPCHMYVAKVLVGKSVKGEKGMRVLPKRNDPLNPELWYDSAVDNTEDPSIFVTFDDHQCYPEYLIIFTTV